MTLPPTFLPLDGDGPFELSICTDVNLALGDIMAVLEMTTIEGKTVFVPLGQQQVIDLRGLCDQVLREIAGKPGTVQ